MVLSRLRGGGCFDRGVSENGCAGRGGGDPRENRSAVLCTPVADRPGYEEREGDIQVVARVPALWEADSNRDRRAGLPRTREGWADKPRRDSSRGMGQAGSPAGPGPLRSI